MKTPINIGTAKTPLDLGHGSYAYKRNGRWHYRTPETGRNFVEATDGELVRELTTRGFEVLYPAHECVDRPELPCPACEKDALRVMGPTMKKGA